MKYFLHVFPTQWQAREAFRGSTLLGQKRQLSQIIITEAEAHLFRKVTTKDDAVGLRGINFANVYSSSPLPNGFLAYLRPATVEADAS